jgi:prophage antirepressor-like protein
MLVKTFQFNDQDLIVHEDIYGELWFRGTNVCSILGFSNPTMAMKTHVGDYLQELSIGEGRPAYYIAEKGLYILTFRAKNPAALEFQLWAADVIKSVRKTGKYIAKPEDQQHFTPFGLEIQKLDSLIDLAKAKGLEPSQVIDLHKQLTGQSDQSQEIMPSPNGGGKKPRDYQVGLRRTLNLARSRGMVTAREIQQMKYFNDKGEIVRGFRELQAQGLGKIEISHNGTSIKFHPAPVPVVKG